MQLGMIGLGKMGANMVRRLCRGQATVVGFNRSPEIVQQLAQQEGMLPASSLQNLIEQLSSPRLVWLMLPHGAPTETAIHDLVPLLEAGDIIIDGGNSNFKESQRRAHFLAEHDIGFIDVGTSGGVWGLANGYCLMAGGAEQDVKHLQAFLEILAPSKTTGWAHVGPVGAGHYTKMVHNGIEYGMMQAYAEGLSLLKGKTEFDLDLAQISELWRHGSVVQSWLLDLTAGFLQQDQTLDAIEPYVSDSGEGRWTIDDATEQGIPTPVLALALHMRFASQDSEGYTNKLLAMMRNAFGGHNVKDK